MKNSVQYYQVLQDISPFFSDKRERRVAGISNNSATVGTDYIFVAIKGANTDGHRFIDQAIARGAHTIVYSEPPAVFRDEITYIRVDNGYYAYALLAECFFDFPAAKLDLIGITGTNGKTSSAFLLRHLLAEPDIACGLISTVEYAFADTVIAAERTAPEAAELQGLLGRMAGSGCRYVVMEVSSHALVQRRTGAAYFSGALFTNLTGEHLDYHGDMESYFAAKRLLFSECLSEKGVMAVNLDDPFGRRLAGEFSSRGCLGFGHEQNCFCEIRKVCSEIGGSVLDFIIDGKSYQFRTTLTGRHNASNLAGSLTLAAALGRRVSEMIECLQQDTPLIPGRLESYRMASGAQVFIDYAHTDDALDNVLSTLRPLCQRQLTVVFGCGGDRDKSKRPRMGAVAAKFADLVILTNDNPRSEEPESIIADIRTGIPKGTSFMVIPDRAQAIIQAVTDAGEGDVVLIAGKGHETYQLIGGTRLDFSDRNEVLRLIESENTKSQES